MKKILIFTAILLIHAIGKAQITELETLFERKGDTITVLEVMKKTEITGQFVLPDTTEFTVEELKTLAEGGSVDKLMKSHQILAGILPPEQAKLGLFTNYYRFGDEVKKGESSVKEIKGPAIDFISSAMLILSFFGIIRVSIGNAGEKRPKLFLFYAGLLLSASIFIVYNAGLFFVLTFVVGACLGWYCVNPKSGQGSILFGLISAFFSGVIILNTNTLEEEYLEPYRFVYWQLILLCALMCVLGFIAREAVARFKKAQSVLRVV